MFNAKSWGYAGWWWNKSAILIILNNIYVSLINACENLSRFLNSFLPMLQFYASTSWFRNSVANIPTLKRLLHAMSMQWCWVRRGIVGRVRSPWSERRNRAGNPQAAIRSRDQHGDARREAAQSLRHHLHARRARGLRRCAGESGAWEVWWLGVGGVAQPAQARLPPSPLAHWK